MRPSLLIAGYLVIVLAPLALGLAQGRPPRPVTDELASGLGMAAFAIMLVEFVLSGRFKMISAKAGMDVTMRFHQLLARTALVFIILHPFLYSTPMLSHPRPWDATGELTLGVTGPTLITGFLAYILFFPFVMTAIFRDQNDQSYESWRLTHGLGAFLIAALIAHHAIGAGRYSSDPLLAGLWLVLLTLAGLTLLSVYLIRPLLQLRRPWHVASVKKTAERTWELVLEPADGHRFSFEAGQFAWINVGHSPFSLYENPFSIASAPADDRRLAFVIKEIGDFTSSLDEIATGTRAYIDGAYGSLKVTGSDAKGLVLIAGGVGVAPMLSILRQMRAESDQRPVVLLYGNRIEEQIVARDELNAMAEDINLTVHHILSEPPEGWTGHTGFVDGTLLDAALKNADGGDWLYAICGPPAMIESVEATLLSRGIHPSRIMSERFRYD